MMESTNARNSAAEPSPMTLDTLGLKCPLPALKARKALKKLAPGAELIVIADDPLAAIDIPHLARELGEDLVEASEGGGRLRFVIRKR